MHIKISNKISREEMEVQVPSNERTDQDDLRDDLGIELATDAGYGESNLNIIQSQEEVAESLAFSMESMIATLTKAIENDSVTPELVEMVENQTMRTAIELGADENKFAIESAFVGTPKERAGIALENATSMFETVIQAITVNTGRLVEGMQERYLGYSRVMQSVRGRAKALSTSVAAIGRKKDSSDSVTLSDVGFGDYMLFDDTRCTDYVKGYQADLAFGNYIYGRFAKDIIGELSTFNSLFGMKANFGNPDFINQLANGLGKLSPADEVIDKKYKNTKNAGFGMAGWYCPSRNLNRKAKKDLTMGSVNLPVGELRSPVKFDYAWTSNGYLHGNSGEVATINTVLQIFEAQDVTITVSDLIKIANMNAEVLDIPAGTFDQMFREFAKYKELVKNTFWKALASPGSFGRIETIRLIWTLDRIAKNYFRMAYNTLIEDYHRRYRVVGNGNRMLRIASRKMEKLQ